MFVSLSDLFLYRPARYYENVWELGKNAVLRIIFLDTLMMSCNVPAELNSMDASYGDCKDAGSPEELQEQYKWLGEVLAKPASVKIVVGHVPILSAGNHGNSQALIKELLPLLQMHHVDLYFAGHNHVLEHLRTPGDNAIDLVVSGAGGFSADPVLSINDNLVTGFTKNGFVTTTISPASQGAHKVVVRFFDLTQTELYSFERTTPSV